MNLWGQYGNAGAERRNVMKNKMFGNCRCKLPMNLQFFAEDAGGAGGAGGSAAGGSGDAGNQGNGNEGGKDGQGAAGQQGGMSFDDFLKDPKNQAEFDRRMAKGIETSKAKMQAEIEAQIANARTEAEKLAKMNAEEKAKYEQQKREGELAAREAEITKRELSAQAKETLAERGLPIGLSDLLNYSSADACQASIEAVQKTFQEAVEKAVEEKLKGGSPMKKAPEQGNAFTKEQISAMSPEEINKNWDAVQASLKNGL